MASVELMKRRRKMLLVLALSIGGSLALLYLMRSRSVLLRIPPDDNIRPRYYCLLNPFRDVAPELLAEQCLAKLRDGTVEVISPLVGQDIIEEERRWPVQSWRVGDRKDDGHEVEIMYWVTRGNGYSKDGYEEQVMFVLVRSTEGWEMKSFGAIY